MPRFALFRHSGRTLLAGLLLGFVTGHAVAVPLILVEAVGTTNRGTSIPFVLDSRATFDFDPDEEILSSAGTFFAQNRTGPNLLIRYSHKVENFSVSATDGFAMKSYECVEGTFGATILRSYCGNYRFGENRTDDGGFVDDVQTGRNLSFYYYEAGPLAWDGATLTVVLLPKTTLDLSGLAEHGITLVFSVID